ncbi:two-component hybrid sensor and regulator [Chondrocystis sp. NIES-4102]|nr:two-component hybrid sensor and regulator [Chondrocystis sp. NIES-4102]
MYYNTIHDDYLPTVLVVQEHQVKLASNSQILSTFNQINIPVINAMTVVAWVQQHQPDLIIFDLEYSRIINLGLVTALRLDWLTRKIPILVIGCLADRLQFEASLDYDGYLRKPYSTRELEQAICSLVSTPACRSLITLI